MSRIRAACITSFQEEINFDESRVTYIIYHREKCPTTGKYHFHIYVEFDKQYVFSTIKDIFNDNTIHIERRRGTVTQAIDYVLKDKNEFEPIEHGERKVQGKRKDLEVVYDAIRSGASLIDVADEHPATYIRNFRGIANVKFLTDQEKTQSFRAVETTVLHGPAGCGKTRYVYDQHGYTNVYKLDAGNNVWFDGYNGQDILLIDDFYGWIKYGQLLNILDGYPLRLDVKGSHTWAYWTKVYITSNKPPAEWYSQGMTPALKRRLTNVTQMSD